MRSGCGRSTGAPLERGWTGAGLRRLVTGAVVSAATDVSSPRPCRWSYIGRHGSSLLSTTGCLPPRSSIRNFFPSLHTPPLCGSVPQASRHSPGSRAARQRSQGQRQRRVVRRFGRLLRQCQPRFQLSDPSQHGLYLPHQRQQREDQRALLGHRQIAEVDLGCHPDVGSRRP